MSTQRLPALFLGHGSPMNVLQDNRYTAAWQQLGQSLPRPQAILAISAHWYTRGSFITAMAQPRTIHDFRGFPQALFDTQYPAPGAPELARQVQQLLAPYPVQLDEGEWGLDHGTWGVLVKLYPAADIPVIQLSIDATQNASYHYALGQKLASLREQGVLILGSGNVVHNLSLAQRQEAAPPYAWASRFEQFVQDHLRHPAQDHPLVAFTQHPDAALANPTPEHYLPLLYVLGAWDGTETISTPCTGMEMGSLSMLSVQVGAA